MLLSQVFSPCEKYFSIKNKNCIAPTSHPNAHSVSKGRPQYPSGTRRHGSGSGERPGRWGRGPGKGPPERNSGSLRGTPCGLASLLDGSHFHLTSCEVWPRAWLHARAQWSPLCALWGLGLGGASPSLRPKPCLPDCGIPQALPTDTDRGPTVKANASQVQL